MTWPEFLADHRRRLIVFMYRRIPYSDVEDMAHVVIELGLRQIPRSAERGVWEAIVWRIAARAVVDYYRRGKFAYAMLPDGVEDERDGFAAVDDLDFAVQTATLVDRRRHRTALMMHALGFTTGEICDHLHVSENNAHQMICRARRDVRAASDPIARSLA